MPQRVIKCRDTGECFTSYKDYLKSEHWANFRESFFLERELMCAHCGTLKLPIHLHHLTYARIGMEYHGDVIPLCKSCHRKVHGKKETKPKKRKPRKKKTASIDKKRGRPNSKEAYQDRCDSIRKSLIRMRIVQDVSPNQDRGRAIQRAESELLRLYDEGPPKKAKRKKKRKKKRSAQ